MSSTDAAQCESVALYLRVSSEEQRGRETIEIQRERPSRYSGSFWRNTTNFTG
jgi:hypothetical protein